MKSFDFRMGFIMNDTWFAYEEVLNQYWRQNDFRTCFRTYRFDVKWSWYVTTISEGNSERFQKRFITKSLLIFFNKAFQHWFITESLQTKPVMKCQNNFKTISIWWCLLGMVLILWKRSRSQGSTERWQSTYLVHFCELLPEFSSNHHQIRV